MKKKNSVRSFEDLRVWQKGIELVKKVRYLDRPVHDELRRDTTTLSAYLFNR